MIVKWRYVLQVERSKGRARQELTGNEACFVVCLLEIRTMTWMCE